MPYKSSRPPHIFIVFIQISFVLCNGYMKIKGKMRPLYFREIEENREKSTFPGCVSRPWSLGDNCSSSKVSGFSYREHQNLTENWSIACIEIPLLPRHSWSGTFFHLRASEMTTAYTLHVWRINTFLSRPLPVCADFGVFIENKKLVLFFGNNLWYSCIKNDFDEAILCIVCLLYHTNHRMICY